MVVNRVGVGVALLQLQNAIKFVLGGSGFRTCSVCSLRSRSTGRINCTVLGV